MAQLLGFSLFILLGIGFIALFILSLTHKVTKAVITDHFQDAEFILERHRAPAVWARPKSFFVLLMQRSRSASLRDRIQQARKGENRETKTKIRVLRRLDELIDFFETCPFFQDEESRDILLGKLSLERVNWEQKRLEEIIAQDPST